MNEWGREVNKTDSKNTLNTLITNIMTYNNITVNRINFISLQVQLQLLFKMYETEPVFEHFSDTFTEKLVTDT